MAGFVVNVYGLKQLHHKHGKKPEIAVVIYMHGRYEDALAEDRIVRDLYSHIRDLKESENEKERNLLIVSFDAQDHGTRLTDQKQRHDLDVNPKFLYDQYAILFNNKDYASYIIDFLPIFLFPRGERNVTRWIAAGRSMGAHSTWHVLSAEPRVKTGFVFIGMPDYNALMKQRLGLMNLTVGPPYVPDTLAALVNRTDPAKTPYTSSSSTLNPFWGKHIFQANGGADPLVPFNLSEHFLKHVVLGPNNKLTKESLEIFVEPHIPHQVTRRMIHLAAMWIYRWEIAPSPNVTLPHIKLNAPTMARPHGAISPAPTSSHD
ncbi:hypothetical protein MCAP1_001241 [Malassezia caprae]|uniref:Uncharacterized protein n=1 Tax=Malassezia caprae TaxID=1381934 RepID=A0AAF0IUU5_9BASI|nr:hypothetical protein MCAP1_001241 [Malassezia caprae]